MDENSGKKDKKYKKSKFKFYNSEKPDTLWDFLSVIINLYNREEEYYEQFYHMDRRQKATT